MRNMDQPTVTMLERLQRQARHLAADTRGLLNIQVSASEYTIGESEREAYEITVRTRRTSITAGPLSAPGAHDYLAGLRTGWFAR